MVKLMEPKTWHELLGQVQSTIYKQPDSETLMQVYQKLQYLATEAHLRAFNLTKKDLNKGDMNGNV